jgi:hypothetical protein
MLSWDWNSVIAFYQDFARRADAWDINLGNAYLDVIRLLQADSETANTYPGIAMFTLYVALPDYDVQSVHIHWHIDSEIYGIFLTPEPNDSPEETRVKLSEVIPTVKEFLQQLRIKRDQT